MNSLKLNIMEPSFHRGDVVRVKERKRYSSSYRCGFSDEMTELTGYTLTVDTIREAQPSTIMEKDDEHIYSLIGCSDNWASSMLEKAPDFTSDSTPVYTSESIIDFTCKKGHYQFNFSL